MKVLQISKYPPIQGGVSAECFWLSRTLANLGHEVTVLTNAREVEDEYRVEWNASDEKFGGNEDLNNGPRVISTIREETHRYIPRGNPSVSKLVSKGLELIENSKPDVIYSCYFEPYAVAGAMLSLATGVPHTVSHAGSDVARLMKSPSLKKTYDMILAQASAVVTNRGEQIGVPEIKRVRPTSNRLSSKFFYAKPAVHRDVFRFGIFGKVGKNKGTIELLDSIARMVRSGAMVELHALWGGVGMDSVIRKVAELDLQQNVVIRHFIPHWRIPDFIWSCDAILFLENSFPILEHSPLVPMEAFMCGRPVLMTKEIAEKSLYQKLSSKGCYSVVPEPFSVDSLESSMRTMIETARAISGHVMEWINPAEHEESSIWATSQQFDRIFELCACKKPR